MHFAQIILPLILVILTQIELPQRSQDLEAFIHRLTPELDDRGTLEQLTLEPAQDSFRRNLTLETRQQHPDHGHQVSRLQENSFSGCPANGALNLERREVHQVSRFQEDTACLIHERGPLICSKCLIKRRRHLRAEISPRGTGFSVTVTDSIVVICHSCVNLRGYRFLIIVLF